MYEKSELHYMCLYVTLAVIDAVTGTLFIKMFCFVVDVYICQIVIC